MKKSLLGGLLALLLFPIAQAGLRAVAGSGSGNVGSGPANQVVATPNGSAGNTGIRSLVTADLPPTPVTAQTASYTVQCSDLGSLITVSSSNVSQTLTLPQPGSTCFTAGASVAVQNVGSYSWTVAATSSTVGGASSLVFPSQTGCLFTTDGTNWQLTGGCLNPSAANTTANVMYYGVFADTARINAFGALNTTAGSPVVSWGATVPGNLVGSTITVTGCGNIGIATAAPGASGAPIAPTTGGSGYAIGDTITLDPTGAGGAATTKPVITVTNVSAGVITQVGILTPGVITTWPTGGAFTQFSSSGAGTGATFTFTESAAVLSTTISSISGNNITLNANCSLTQTNVNGWVWYGHDDQAGIQAALNSGKNQVDLPANKIFGIRSPLTFPSTRRIILDCHGSTIVALNPIAEMFLTGSSDFWDSQGSGIQNCLLDGAGNATYNLVSGSSGWMIRNNMFRNAVQTNILVQGNGGGIALNSFYTNLIIENDSYILPAGDSQYCIQVSSASTDNHFTDIIGVGCTQAGTLDAASGSYWTNVHWYGIWNGHHFQMTGSATTLTADYADNPYGNYDGFYLTGNNHTLSNNKVYVSGSNQQNQGGIHIQSGQNDTITGSNINGLVSGSTRGCEDNGNRINNYFGNNIGCTYSSTPILTMLGFSTLAGVTAAGATDYIPFGAGGAQNSVLKANIISPYTGTLSNLYVQTNGDIGNGNTYQLKVIVNGSASSITCTATGAGSGNDICNDLTNTATVTAGQPIALQVITSASASSVSLFGGLKFVISH